MTDPTSEQIAKLPKWAQEYIRQLERERAEAIRALNRYCDDQTPSAFRIHELESTGETVGPSQKTRHIQTHKMEVDWQGVELTIILRNDSIDLQWRGSAGVTSECAFIPRSFQAANLKSRDYLY